LTRKTKIIAAVGVIVMALVITGFLLRGSSANYYITPAELKQQVGYSGEKVRVAGKVVNNSMKWDEANSTMSFKIRFENEKVVLPVVYQGLVPETFTQDSKVIVEGFLNASKVFEAEKILVKCPENYLPEKAVGSLFKAGGLEGVLYR